MTKVTLLEYKSCDFKVPALVHVKPPKLGFKVVADMDKKVMAAVDKDPMLQQKMVDAAQAEYKRFCASIRQKMITFDKLFTQMIDKGAPKAMVEKQAAGLKKTIEGEIAVGEKAAELAVQGAFDKLKATKKEWKKFKVKIITSIIGTVTGMVVSITLMATSPFTGGASAVLGITGLIKSTASLAKSIGAAAIDIKNAVKLMDKTAKVVEKTMGSHAAFNTNEATAAVLQEFIGISQPSFKTLEEQGSVVKAKHAQMTVKIHDAAKKLNEVLKLQSKVKKEFLTEASKKLKKHPTTKKKENLAKIQKQLDAALAENYKKVQGLIDYVIGMNKDSIKWGKEIKRLMAIVARLAKMDNKGLKILREALKLVGTGLAVLNGNEIATKASDLASGLGPAVGAYAYDKIASKAIDGTVFDAA